jgi:uncharacterized protein (DUF2336 family)
MLWGQVMAASARSYGNVKDLIQDPDPVVRREVAASANTAPEILFFLVNDVDALVRRAVAGNPATPRQADTILAKDRDYGVRCELARKIVGTGLDDDERSQLWRMGFTILETLATDQVVRVRKALAEALKGWVSAPRPVVTRLARDAEPEVAGPVIENSPVLTDDDLADIIGNDAPDWMIAAASRRSDIGPRLAGAIAATGRTAPITDMLNNDRAEISDTTIDDLAERAEDVEEFRAPLVRRPHLTGKAVLGLARFVSGPLLSLLRGRGNLDPETERQLNEIARTRPGPDPAAVAAPATADFSAGAWGGSDDRALRLFQAGKLNDAAVELALDSRDQDFVVAALALRSRIAQAIVERVIATRSAKLITAICWKGGFNMRFALDIQKRLAQIQPRQLLYARDGFDYPMSEAEMDQQLAVLTG